MEVSAEILIFALVIQVKVISIKAKEPIPLKTSMVQWRAEKFQIWLNPMILITWLMKIWIASIIEKAKRKIHSFIRTGLLRWKNRRVLSMNMSSAEAFSKSMKTWTQKSQIARTIHCWRKWCVSNKTREPLAQIYKSHRNSSIKNQNEPRSLFYHFRYYL